MISVPWLYEELEKSPARFKMILIDACRNSIVDHGSKSVSKMDPGQLNKLTLSKENFPKNTILLASCKSGQKSYEDPAIRRGLFSFYFTQGLAGAADNDPADEKISYEELLEYVQDRTKDHAKAMDPKKNKLRMNLTRIGKVKILSWQKFPKSISANLRYSLPMRSA